MSVAEQWIGYQDLELVSPYPITILKGLKIERKVNEHATIEFSGIIPEEKQDSCIISATYDDPIEVYRTVNGNRVQTLFKGRVVGIEIQVVAGVYHLKVEGRSHTFDLDVKRKSRSFQNLKQKLKDLIDQILADYSGADCNDQVIRQTTLDQFMIQYQETDWSFIKRIASRFGAVLIPAVDTDKPKFWLGLPEGKARAVEDFHYQAQKDLTNYLRSAKNFDHQVDEIDFIRYEIESGQYLDIGDRVNIQEKDLVVSHSIALMRNGTLRFRYGLTRSYGVRQNPIFNQKLVGTALDGKVIDVAEDQVKIHLNIDKAQNKEEACWFPYDTFYTAEGNSGWYCMPQIGDNVKLYFPSVREEEALATGSVRSNEGKCGKISDPGIKYLGTNHGKELKFGGQELVMTAKDTEAGSIYIKLDETKGIEVHSEKEVNLYSEQDFVWNAAKKIDIQADQGIYLVCNSSSIILDGVTDIRGSKVTLKAESAPAVAEPNAWPPDEPKAIFDGPCTMSATPFKMKADFFIADWITPCIPVIGEMNDLSIAVTGLDLHGNLRTGIEQRDAKFSLLLAVATLGIGSALVKNIKLFKNAPKVLKKRKVFNMAKRKMVTLARKIRDRIPLDEVVERLKRIGKERVTKKQLIKVKTLGKADVDKLLSLKSPKERYEYLMKKIELLDVSTGKNQAIFYSGSKEVSKAVREKGYIAAREWAESYADEYFKRTGRIKLTLERTPGGKWLDELDLFSNKQIGLTKEQAREVWRRLSERYAEEASGSVTAFCKYSRDTSIFKTAELPALRKNKNVTHINIR